MHSISFLQFITRVEFSERGCHPRRTFQNRPRRRQKCQQRSTYTPKSSNKIPTKVLRLASLRRWKQLIKAGLVRIFPPWWCHRGERSTESYLHQGIKATKTGGVRRIHRRWPFTVLQIPTSRGKLAPFPKTFSMQVKLWSTHKAHSNPTTQPVNYRYCTCNQSCPLTSSTSPIKILIK